MNAAMGPESLTQFEDRVLYHLVELTGDRALLEGEGVSEAALAERLADELDVPADMSIGGAFHGSPARMHILATVSELEDDGFVHSLKVSGPWAIRPTAAGRRRVAEWRKNWERQRQELDTKIQQRILEELDQQQRADPDSHASTGRLDVATLCAELDITEDDYRANARRLIEQGKIAPHDDSESTIEDGFAYITDAGVKAVEAKAAAARPRRDAQEAWVEVARLRRQLEIATRTRPSLIADEELRRRCDDLLAAGEHYDRVVREACVILENRVRVATGADRSSTGVPLMEQAFSPKGGALQLSTLDQEQVGAMQLYRGIMAFFRNAAGHHISDTYSLDDALRFVGWIDLLLEMVKTAGTAATAAGNTGTRGTSGTG